IFVALVFLTRYVSLGSLVAMFFYPIFVLYFTGEYTIAILGFVICCLIIYRHGDNIKRLIAGKERKLGDKIT
ncbi:MAG: glycerol-3-phosphate acyltransferase, partial [Candidatus Aminicenantes bacterium]